VRTLVILTRGWTGGRAAGDGDEDGDEDGLLLVTVT